MAYRIEYHEQHDGEEIGSHVHVYLSGSEFERAQSLELIESALGENLAFRAYGIFGDATNYKVRSEDWPWRNRDDCLSRLEKEARMFGVRGMRDGDLRRLEDDFPSPYSLDAMDELGLRQREAGHMVNQWYPPSY